MLSCIVVISCVMSMVINSDIQNSRGLQHSEVSINAMLEFVTLMFWLCFYLPTSKAAVSKKLGHRHLFFEMEMRDTVIIN